MNIKEINLKLSVGLINLKNSTNILRSVLLMMQEFKSDVGNYLGLVPGKFKTTGELSKHTYTIEYENCTIDLDLVVNQTTQNQYIYSLNLKK